MGKSWLEGVNENSSPLLSVAEPDLREEAGIVELFGVSFYFAGAQARVRLEAGSREQLLLRVLRRALKADRGGAFLCAGGIFFCAGEGREQRRRAAISAAGLFMLGQD